MGLTRKQDVVLEKIEKFLLVNKYPPSVREVATMVGLKSANTAHGYLERLKKKGFISWEQGKPRTLKVIKK